MNPIEQVYETWNAAPYPQRLGGFWWVGPGWWTELRAALASSMHGADIPMKKYGEFGAFLLGRPVGWADDLDGFEFVPGE